MAPAQPAPEPKRSSEPTPWDDEPPIPVREPNGPLCAGFWAPEPVRGTGDHEISRLGALQRGFVTHDQLAAAGLTRHAIAHRLTTGRLTLHHKGVYLVGRPSLEPLGRETAAVLFCAGHAVLSHLTAAHLWALTPARPDDVSVTLVGRDLRSRSGLHFHRVTQLDRADLRRRHRLPVTSPARTVLDIAALGSSLERVLAEAQVQRLLRPGDLEDAIERAPHHRGVARLRALLEAGRDPALTRKEAEERMLALIRDAQLPAPIVNGRVHGLEVDFRWPDQRLIVEIDGYQFHGHRAAFERDRRRDQTLAAAGYRVIRVTWRQLVEEPLAVIARIAMALTAQAA